MAEIQASELNAPRRRELIGLDAIRFCAATLVMLYHFGYWHWTKAAQLLTNMFPGRSAPAPALNFGWVGVEIFFVLSGFVIAYSAEAASPRSFLRSRVLRLVPGVWICATVAVVLYATVAPITQHALIWNYVCSMLFVPLGYIDSVYWTLSIEISFYAVMLMLLRFRRFQRLEAVAAIFGLLSGAFWVAALTLQSILAGRAGWAAVLHTLVLKAEGNRWLQLMLVQHGCLFALGVLLYAAYRHGLNPARTSLIAALTVCCGLEIVGQNGIIARAAGESLSPLPALLAWSVAMALIVLSVRFNDTVRRLSGPVAPSFRFVGKMTYPLYLIHNSVGLALCFVLAKPLGAWALLVGMAGAVIAAALVQGFAEPFVRGYIARLWDRWLGLRVDVKMQQRQPSPAAP
jgi:peptidoglycan/LPS O-acetylase OafA/YrhL